MSQKLYKLSIQCKIEYLRVNTSIHVFNNSTNNNKVEPELCSQYMKLHSIHLYILNHTFKSVLILTVLQRIFNIQ